MLLVLYLWVVFLVDGFGCDLVVLWCFRLCELSMFVNLVLVLFLGFLVAWCNLLCFSDTRDFVV